MILGFLKIRIIATGFIVYRFPDNLVLSGIDRLKASACMNIDMQNCSALIALYKIALLFHRAYRFVYFMFHIILLMSYRRS